MEIPEAAIGISPTGVNTEYLPPTSSGITKVLNPYSSESFFNAPFFASVVAKILFFKFSFPYFFSVSASRLLNASAGSVVVPDLEITFTENSLSCKKSNKSL